MILVMVGSKIGGGRQDEDGFCHRSLTFTSGRYRSSRRAVILFPGGISGAWNVILDRNEAFAHLCDMVSDSGRRFLLLRQTVLSIWCNPDFLGWLGHITGLYASGFHQVEARFTAPIPLSCRALGRGFPDVAVHALNSYVVIRGRIYALGGISASLPVRHPQVPLIYKRLALEGHSLRSALSIRVFRNRLSAGIRDVFREGENRIRSY